MWPEAYRIAYSVIGDSGLAEDAAQDACAAIARTLPTLANTNAFAGWSYKIVVNAAVSLGRRRPRTQPLETIADRGVSYDRTDTLDVRDALATLSVVLSEHCGLPRREDAPSSWGIRRGLTLTFGGPLRYNSGVVPGPRGRFFTSSR